MFTLNEKKLLKKMLILFSPFKKKIILIVICLLIGSAVSLLTPIVSKILIDDGIMQNDYNVVLIMVGAMLSLIVVNVCMDIAKEILRTKIVADFLQSLYLNVFNSLISISNSYFEDKNSTEIHNEMDLDVSRIASICDNSVFFSLTQVLSFLGGMIGLFIIDSRLALLVLIFIPIKFCLVKFMSKKRGALVNTYIYRNSKLAHWLGDSIAGMKEIRLFGIESAKSKELENKVHSLTDANRRVAVLDSLNVASDILLIHFLEALLYAVGTKYIFSGSLTIGSLFAFITYSMQVMNPITTVLDLSYMLSAIFPSAERYFSFLKKAEDEKEPSGQKPINSIQQIEFNNVSFAYSEKHILTNVSFVIKKGEHVAIVGKNGTGKTTILRLIQSFLQPTSGQILVNDFPLSEYDIKKYRNSFSCINQDSYLFDKSIMDNVILYGSPSNQDANIILHESGVAQFLDMNPSTVGVNGCQLSGGQRQKVFLARMLYRDRELYLLDEATSNMDQESHASIIQALNTVLKSKTVIIIAHSNDFLEHMDSIITLERNGVSQQTRIKR